MARRTWIGTLVIIALIVAGTELPGRPSALRSAHAEPAAAPPAHPVVVTPGGKLFHEPSCTFLHGAALPIDAQEALRQGYTPCIRCEAMLLAR